MQLEVQADPAALNTNAASPVGSDSLPQLTTDGEGNWVAVWNSNDDVGGTIGGDLDILVARFRLTPVDFAIADLNDDRQVDVRDAGAFQRLFTGP